MPTSIATRQRRIATSATTKVEWLPLGSLIVDPDLQRPQDERFAQSIAEGLDPDLLGVVHVSARANGVYHITDGQHRVAGLRLAGFGPEQLVLCLVSYNLTAAGEAHRFNGLNTARSPRAFDRFRVRLKAEDPIALGVDRILMEHGWRVVSGDSVGCFTAVAKAEAVYVGYGTKDKTRGPQNLHDTLGVITEAWGRESHVAHGSLIAGLGLFFAEHGGEVDKAALVRRLAQFPGGSDGYIGKARGIREFRGGSVTRCVAELTVEVYNRRRTNGRLPEWRS